MRISLGRHPALVITVSLFAASSAQAAARLVVLPVAVGGGPEPAAPLMTALAEGLRQNTQWAVEEGEILVALAKAPPATLGDEELATLTAQIEAAEQKLGAGAPSEALPVLERVRGDLLAAAKKGPRGKTGDDLAWRSGGLVVAALLASNDSERARKVADETALLFPGRKPTDADKLSPEAALLLAKPSPGLGAKLTIKTRPEGCEVLVGGVSLGRAPVELPALPGATYYAQARCSGPAGGGAAASAESFLKKITFGGEENVRQEVLDAEFESSFRAENLRRLTFASSNERRQLEESYARRVAERFDADVVVLASVGELSGADWLNARLYLRSGYLNRQGLVRLEAPRANALGRYLATGKDVPGVLKPEEAGALVAAGQQAASQEKRTEINPWYTDIPGWSFLGLGITGMAFGYWGSKVHQRKQNQAEELRDDYDRQQRLFRESQTAKFWSGVGTVGGILMASTGVILLLIPEYNTTDSELFVLSPTPLRGGAALTLGGRF
jgi:hypothetical protein